MELNADFSQRAAVHAGRLPWAPSPMQGVERRMLDRVGGEVARATSIVRYAPGSQFSPHTHGGGEEFFVLEGVFQDEQGDYPVGSYGRNPPESRHRPGSAPGCTIFVKLWQFDPADRAPVRLETGAMPPRPAPGRGGVEVLRLYRDEVEEVRLERWAPGAAVELAAPYGIEVLVLEGGFEESGKRFEGQSWLRLPPGAVLRAASGPRGCRVWLKTGHLARIRVPA
jgi:anti-sigma factor ChrR (cupin superfamily)